MTDQQIQIDYTEFRKRYEEQHPASVPELRYEASHYPYWVKYAVLAMFLSAAAISGVHTVPTVQASIGKDVSSLFQDVASVASFMAVELACLLSAYFMVRDKWLGGVILSVTVVIMLTANVYSSMSAMGAADDFQKVVAILIGIGIPLIVLMAGKLLVTVYQSERAVNYKAEQKYLEERKAFDTEIVSAYEKYQQRFVRLSARLSAGQLADGQADTGADGQPDRRTATGQGYTKRTDARTMVQDYLRSNPDEINGNVRAIAEKLGVGKSTVSEVQREFKGGGQVDIQQEADRIIGGQQHETQL